MLFAVTSTLLVLTVCLMAWFIKKVYQHFDTLRMKIALSGLTTLFFISVLLGDEILGRIYINYLCATESAPKIYQTVELGPEFWNQDGSPKFMSPPKPIGLGYFRKNTEKILLKEYEIRVERSTTFYGQMKFISKKTMITNVETNKDLADYSEFYFFRGWLMNNMGLRVRSTSCPTTKLSYTTLVNDVFKKSK